MSFLKVSYNICKIKQKSICFEKYHRLHVDDPNIAICGTTSDTIFIIKSTFTSKDHYFQAALEEADQAFNAIMLDFTYQQTLQKYDPEIHHALPPSKHPFSDLTKTSPHHYFSFLH